MIAASTMKRKRQSHRRKSAAKSSSETVLVIQCVAFLQKRTDVWRRLVVCWSKAEKVHVANRRMQKRVQNAAE
jgi:hypothetical protein